MRGRSRSSSPSVTSCSTRTAPSSRTRYVQSWTTSSRSSGSSRSRPSLQPAGERPRALVRHQRQPVVVGRRAPQRQARAVDDERQLRRRARGPRGAVRRGVPGGLDLALAPRDLVARRRPLGRLAQEEAERDVLVPGDVEHDVLALSRRRVQRWQLAPLPLAPQVRQVGEVVAIVDPEATRGGVERLHAHGRRQVLQLVHRRVRRAVRPHEAVGAEVRVVARLAEVAAVGPVLAPVARPCARMPWSIHSQTKPPCRRVVAVERGVVVGEAAVAVAHRVRELAQDQRARVVAGSAAAHASIESTSAYIGQTMSVAGRPPDQSRAIAPS